MTPVSYTPLQAIVGSLVVMLLLSVLLGSIISWSLWFSGKRPEVIARQPMATIGFVDLMVTFAIMITLYAIAMLLWRMSLTPSGVAQVAAENTSQTPEPLTEAKFIFSGLAMSTQLLCVFLVTLFIRSRTGCSLATLGWRFDHLRADLRAGLQCFLMLTPVALLLNAILIQWTDVPYDHPIQQMLEKYPWLLGIAFWQACIVAPISEEFAFRSLLIGWFESVHSGKEKLAAFLVGYAPPTPARAKLRDSGESLPGDSVREQADAYRTGASIPIAAADSQNPYSPPMKTFDEPMALRGGSIELSDPVGISPSDATVDPTISATRYRPPWWPALVSGGLFGIAHLDYGVSWISLILFGIVLGRLYQLRQSLVPVIFVHILFNGLSMIFMAAKLIMPES
jgi:membrane protease YdiL (CAAX protease family)